MFASYYRIKDQSAKGNIVSRGIKGKSSRSGRREKENTGKKRAIQLVAYCERIWSLEYQECEQASFV